MDLSRLVNDTSSQRTDTTSATQQQRAQAPSTQSSYPAYDSRVPHGQPQLARQASFGRPHELDHGPAPPMTSQYTQQPLQSPSSYLPPAHPSPYSASRPSSNGHERYPATPLQLQPPNNSFNQSYALSPTPSSHRSHTPHSVHHSPLPALQNGVPGALGPPQARPATYHHEQLNSPQQYRTSLGPPQRKSTDYTTGSPLAPPSRRVSGRSNSDRETSASVSPKTQPMPAPLSHGSRQSSIYEDNGGYRSRQSSVLNPLPPDHTTSQSVARGLNSLANITTNHSYTSPVAITRPSPQSSTTPSTAERSSIRRSTTMDLSNMLSNEPPAIPQASVAKEQEESVRVETNGMHTGSKKRAPVDDIASTRPTKKERTRRHTERPIWAQLSPRNPRSDGRPVQKSLQHARPAAVPTAAAKTNQSVVYEASAHPTSTNGAQAPSAASINHNQPWLNPLPYDMDLIHARSVFGAWEKSIKWNTPYPDMLRAVQDWLMLTLQSHQDILGDPSAGTIEIEAKIGRLVKPSNNNRADLPVLNMTLLQPGVNRDYRFESELQESDFIVLNEFLNKTLVESNQPGRQRMVYKRVSEKDSFSHLSPAGLAMLPKSLLKRNSAGRELKLRTTTQVKTHDITARIVKVNLADLHIYNPNGYDCRISMNAEVNMIRPGQAPEELIIPATNEKPEPPSRTKDRLSYKHLAYQIDLTKVDVAGLASKYEMEIEVDAQALSSQIQLMSEGKPHAFSEVSKDIPKESRVIISGNSRRQA
ncbi:hypothetical protein AMS68_003604 [Peltaster fructicola]|uniref:mRNA-capping enzyme subunit beta n=1 Tax=Peltaster fructicola TaxID=286661 RepID=A0A6H0XTJ3_9PEZI|nr:hypothetical protein AMS68_003604 [Peltaster fructicola]